jgi:hypothetical protein
VTEEQAAQDRSPATALKKARLHAAVTVVLDDVADHAPFDDGQELTGDVQGVDRFAYTNGFEEHRITVTTNALDGADRLRLDWGSEDAEDAVDVWHVSYPDTGRRPTRRKIAAAAAVEVTPPEADSESEPPTEVDANDG